MLLFSIATLLPTIKVDLENVPNGRFANAQCDKMFGTGGVKRAGPVPHSRHREIQICCHKRQIKKLKYSFITD